MQYVPLTISSKDAAVIHLTQGKISLVSPCDWDMLNQYDWHWQAHRSFGVGRTSGTQNKKKVLLHRMIMGVVDRPAPAVDHINHDSLDNRRCNLRLASSAQNSFNKRKYRGNYSSQFKGVSYDKQYGQWRAMLDANHVRVNLGRFDDELSAAAAYDKAAQQYYGEFAFTNFKPHRHVAGALRRPARR